MLCLFAVVAVAAQRPTLEVQHPRDDRAPLPEDLFLRKDG